MAKSNDQIVAAGVVLLREYKGEPQVCVLHRPTHRDWSLPKGKLESREHIIACARRETIEETGEDVVLGVPLLSQNYRVEGRPKIVRYWVGWVKEGGPGFAPNREIDELEWLSPNKAARRLTYRRDVQIIRSALDVGPTSPLILLRHSQAIRRAVWKGSKDVLRPLAPVGKGRARTQVSEVLAAFGIESIQSSDALRCVQTVRPYADSAKLKIEMNSLFSEEGFEPSKKASLGKINALLTDPAATVLCTHRPVFPEIIAQVRKRTGLRNTKQLDPALPPGGFIVLHRRFDPKRGIRVIAVERHAP